MNFSEYDIGNRDDKLLDFRYKGTVFEISSFGSSKAPWKVIPKIATDVVAFKITAWCYRPGIPVVGLWHVHVLLRTHLEGLGPVLHLLLRVTY